MVRAEFKGWWYKMYKFYCKNWMKKVINLKVNCGGQGFTTKVIAGEKLLIIQVKGS